MWLDLKHRMLEKAPDAFAGIPYCMRSEKTAVENDFCPAKFCADKVPKVA